MKYINDEKVQESIEEAAKIACEKLDSIFPGFDNGGVTSSFQGTLAKCLSDMLQGKDPYGRCKLNKLAIDTDYFGNEVPGHTQGYVVVKNCDLKVLNIYGHFVNLSDDSVDPFVDFDHAAKSAMNHLSDDFSLSVKPVFFNSDSYSFEEKKCFG